MRSGEQQRVCYGSDKAAKIASEYAVKEKAEKKFLHHRRDCHRENNDHDALPDGGRRAEKLDDILSARTGSEKALGNCFSQSKQRIGKEKQDRAGSNGANKTDSEKTA